jgi:hypothetical protein
MTRTILCSLLLAVAHSAAAIAGPPTVIRHPAPELSVDASPFEGAGCQESSQAEFRCPPDSPLGRLGCEWVGVSDLLGGLEPRWPIASCSVLSNQVLSEDEYVLPPHGLAPIWVRYVVFADGEFRVLASIADLRRQFAPIESPEEALSFAVAVTELTPFHDFEPAERLAFEVDTLEETHVEPASSGFVIHDLRYYKQFGCGPHPTSLVTVSVSREGVVEELERQRVFRDPAEDGLCVD